MTQAMARNRHLAIPVAWWGSWPRRGDALAILIPGRDQGAPFMLDVAQRLALPRLNCAVVEAADNSWYPGRFMNPLETNQPHLDHALERIDVLVQEAERRGIPRERIALMGFSQGACAACEYVFRRGGRWGALIAMTGGLFGPEGHRWSHAGASLKGTPVLLTNSDVDPWIPLDRTHQTAGAFHALNALVVQRTYFGRPHEISAPEIGAAREILLTLLPGESSNEVLQ